MIDVVLVSLCLRSEAPPEEPQTARSATASINRFSFVSPLLSARGPGRRTMGTGSNSGALLCVRAWRCAA
jgi:hypothetical protein